MGDADGMFFQLFAKEYILIPTQLKTFIEQTFLKHFPFYDEIGGGAYVSFGVGTGTNVGIEFRLGRDLTYYRFDEKEIDGNIISDFNRYTFVIDFQGWQFFIGLCKIFMYPLPTF